MADRAGREATAPVGRPADRLPEPRRGHPHRAGGGAAQGRPDRALRPDRAAGRLHPRHPPASVGADRGDGHRERAQGAGRGAGHAAGPVHLAGQAVEEDRPGPGGRPQGDDLAAPHDYRRGCGCVGLRGARGLYPARGHHRHPVGARLDPRRQGQGRGPVGAQVQGGRRARLPRAGLHHGQDPGRRLGRPGLPRSGPTSWPAGVATASRCV